MIIEAGEENYSEESQELYQGKTIGDEIMPLSKSRLRQFGGTSGHWGGWSSPLENYTFDLWPIKAEELSPYLIKTCEILDINNISESICDLICEIICEIICDSFR